MNERFARQFDYHEYAQRSERKVNKGEGRVIGFNG